MDIQSSVSSPLNGSENWVTIEKHKNRITTTEMRYIRRVTGKTRRGRVRSNRVREELTVEPLGQLLEKR